MPLVETVIVKVILIAAAVGVLHDNGVARHIGRGGAVPRMEIILKRNGVATSENFEVVLGEIKDRIDIHGMLYVGLGL